MAGPWREPLVAAKADVGAAPGGRKTTVRRRARPLPRRWDIYEEHLSEAGFLWTQWQAAMQGPESTMAEIQAGEEERLRAHLHALVLGGMPVRKELLLPALADEDPERAFAAAAALLAADEGDFGALVVDALTNAPPDAHAGFEGAFVLAPRDRLASITSELLAAESTDLQAMGLRVLGERPDVLVSADALEPHLQQGDPRLLAPALRALPGVAAPAHTAYIERALGGSDAEVAEAAMEAGCVLGLASAWRAARRAVETRAALAGRAPLLLAVRGNQPDVTLLVEAASHKKLRREVLWALGFTGSWVAIEACVRYVADGKVAKLAGEALATITGVDLRRERLVVPPDEDEDDEAGSAPEDGLPMPDPVAVSAWWESRRSSWRPMVRHLDGQPWSNAVLLDAFERGSARRWAGLTVAAAVASRGAARISARTWASERRRALLAARPLLGA